jgi:transposase InsO family protein
MNQNKELLKELHKKPIKEKSFPHLNINSPHILNEIDILYLPSDKGFKYLLTCIDVYNSLCNAQPLKNNGMNNILKKLDDIYEKSDYLSYPNCIQADNQFNNKYFKKWCKDREINTRFSAPYNHRQQAHIERLNQTIGKKIFEYQEEKELETDKPCKKWLNVYKKTIDEINEKHLEKLDDNLKKKDEEDEEAKIEFNKKTDYLIENGSHVRLRLDHPETLQGKKLNGNFRKTDIRYRNKPLYEVVESYLFPNSPPLYKLKDLSTNKIISGKYTNERLQIIKDIS